MKTLLDTHAWIWWHLRPERLSKRAHDLIRNAGPGDELLLSAISPWEFSKLVAKGRLKVSMETMEWIRRALAMPALRLVPLTPEIAHQSTTLPQPFHDDPADQIIVATAREESAAILTKDEHILEYKHVRAIW